MRYGFTTGSCAAAAAKAAAYMLLTGKSKASIQIDTPKGVVYETALLDCKRSEQQASCAVLKDGGDDPDVTTGTRIYAKVTLLSEPDAGEEASIVLDGGIGIGRVTRPGLDQPVGNAAINRVPRQMIWKEVMEVCRLVDFKGSLGVVIYVPEGEALALKTFNPRLGILGGISILGTTGIVEPMSSRALLDTIRAELRVRRAEGQTAVAVTPGNYGAEFMMRTYGYSLNQSVTCSNFIGDTIDMAAELGFREVLITGHIGKLVKLSGGMMNTHSKEGDCRMELLAAHGIQAGISAQTAQAVLSCVSTEEALMRIKEEGKLSLTMEKMLEKIIFYVRKKAEGRLRIECIVYASMFGELCRSEQAAALLHRILEHDS